MRGSSGCAALVGGALSAGAYAVVLWAMARAPVAAVAALRETSVIFAALIGAWLLKEGHIARRIAGGGDRGGWCHGVENMSGSFLPP